MLTAITFEAILQRSESTLIDYKKTMYDFSNDQDLIQTAKLVKDVISFCNTIRTEPAYIIIGVEENKENGKVLHGIAQSVDDAMFQDKLKEKVYPRPTFNYSEIQYQHKLFAVLHFPVTKYSAPITPVIKMKGLEVGKAYYRMGSTNTEATALEVIKINDWLKSLPEYVPVANIQIEVNHFIKKLTLKKEPLSSILTELHLLGKRYQQEKLILFCSQELSGHSHAQVRVRYEQYEYRRITTFVSPHKLQLSQWGGLTGTPARLKKEMDEHDQFVQERLIYVEPILQIEEALARPQSLVTLPMIGKDYFDDENDTRTVYGYLFNDAFVSLYESIRQETLDRLMKI